MTQLVDWLRHQTQRWPPLYAVLRSVKRAVVPPRDRHAATDGPALSQEMMRARIEVKGPLPPFNVGAPVKVAVDVTNLSPRAWPGDDWTALSYHWHRPDGGVWARDGGRAFLPQSLGPGSTASVELLVAPPNTPAAYILELELVYGRDAWFGASGSSRRDVVVGGMQPDKLPEIDYERIYEAADLTENYWGVSGPASAAEFQQLGEAKLKMLQQLGLKPDSRVLDVGCGTGSFTEALAGFLGSGGVYYGTDLSEVAVQFCREKFARPNFFFAKNGMTTIPIDDRRFDYIVFFSVFTHTYPAETRDLLAEAKRLLGDGGVIIADVFETDIHGDSLGTRAMTVLPRRRLLEIAEALGLEAQTMSEFTWDPTGPRKIDRVMRRFSKASA